MTDTTSPEPDPAAPPERLELSPYSRRPAPADRDLGRPILDSPLVHGSMWLHWTGHDGIRTLHHGAGLARGWTERDVDGLDGWVVLVEGRIVLGACPGLAVPERAARSGPGDGPHAGRRTRAAPGRRHGIPAV